MKSTDSRDLILVPIASQADSEYIRTIPTAQATSGDGSVSMDLGFPPECAISVAAGGKRPEMKDVNGVYNLLSSAIQSLQSYFGTYNADLSTAIGGYPLNAIVADSATVGLFWVSTVDDNTTVPGATGASWQSLFDGYATESWAEGEFLQLSDAATQTVTGPVIFEGETEVPDTEDFTGKDALNAETAEGRYVSSVPASGSTNTRIVDVQEDASGNLIATLSDGTTESFAPTSTQTPADANTTTQAKVMIIGDMMFQSFYVANYQNDAAILFPVAFAAGEVPNVVAVNSPNPTDSWSSFCNPYQASVTNTGFKIQQSYLSAAGATGTANGPNVWVMAMGKI